MPDKPSIPDSYTHSIWARGKVTDGTFEFIGLVCRECGHKCLWSALDGLCCYCSNPLNPNIIDSSGIIKI